jgi:hypothetical protein
MTESVIPRIRLGSVLPEPLTFDRSDHCVRKFDVDYLRDQIYLDPHPHELMLLNEL